MHFKVLFNQAGEIGVNKLAFPSFDARILVTTSIMPVMRTR